MPAWQVAYHKSSMHSMRLHTDTPYQLLLSCRHAFAFVAARVTTWPPVTTGQPA